MGGKVGFNGPSAVTLLRAGRSTCGLLLGRLTKIGQHEGALNKHNLMLSGDPYALAHGYPDGEELAVREHLFGAPWTKLVNEGHPVDSNSRASIR
jgi:hypothetical protein